MNTTAFKNTDRYGRPTLKTNQYKQLNAFKSVPDKQVGAEFDKPLYANQKFIPHQNIIEKAENYKTGEFRKCSEMHAQPSLIDG